jgi:DNA-binding CsgD family transcriptional regulator
MSEKSQIKVAVSQNLPLPSKRQSEVLQLIQQGLSNKLIARKLNIAESTVKVHVSELLRKCCVTNRSQLGIFTLQGKQAVLPDLEAKPFLWVKINNNKIDGVIFSTKMPYEGWTPLYRKMYN